jgi:hypothetical protein
VGKQRTNEMHGINHEYEILLDHLNDINFLHQMHLTTTMMSFMKMIEMRNMNDFDNDMENHGLSYFIYNGDLITIQTKL